MRVGISLTTNYPDVKDPRQGARWIIERATAARRAGLDSLFIGDQHASPTPYYQNTPMLGRLLAEWSEVEIRNDLQGIPRVALARRPLRG